MDLAKLSITVKHTNPDYTPVVYQKIGCEFEFPKGNGLQSAGLQKESSADLAACRVAVRVQNAIAAMGAFPGESNLGPGPVELGAPLNQFLDALRPFFNQDAGGLCVAQTIARLECIVEMNADFVIIAEGCGDAPLRILGVGLCNFALGETQHTAGGGEFYRSSKACDARAYDDEIGFAG